MFGRKKQTTQRMIVPADQTVILTEDIVGDWFSAADQRDVPIIEQMNDVLRELAHLEPVRVWMFKRELKWLRREAAKRGYPWGTG